MFKRWKVQNSTNLINAIHLAWAITWRLYLVSIPFIIIYALIRIVLEVNIPTWIDLILSIFSGILLSILVCFWILKQGYRKNVIAISEIGNDVDSKYVDQLTANRIAHDLGIKVKLGVFISVGIGLGLTAIGAIATVTIHVLNKFSKPRYVTFSKEEMMTVPHEELAEILIETINSKASNIEIIHYITSGIQVISVVFICCTLILLGMLVWIFNLRTSQGHMLP